MKKITALALCFCMLCMPAYASNGLSIGMSGPKEVEAGKEIELVFTFPSIDTEGLCGFDIELGFDSTLVEFASVSISGFPEGAAWTAAGRVSGSTYFLHVFDDYGGGAPVSIYQGTKAFVSIKFRALETTGGIARFSTASYGAVMGCYFANGETVSFVGAGSEVNVKIKGFVNDGVYESYHFKKGVLYALPGVTALDLPYAVNAVTDKNGKAKAKNAPLVTGDIVDLGTDYVKSTVMILCDVNADGRVTTNDYMLLKLHLKGERALPDAVVPAADINMDGGLSAADAVYFARLLCGESLNLKATAD